MSPVIPRPVGPTTDWYGSATTTASLPRSRTHVRPYQVSSIAPILTQPPCTPSHRASRDGTENRRPAVEAKAEGGRRAHLKVRERPGPDNARIGHPGAAGCVHKQERPEVPAQSAPPVEGGRDGTFWVRPMHTLRERLIQGRDANRLRKRHRGRPNPGSPRTRATIPAHVTPSTHPGARARRRSSSPLVAPCCSRPAARRIRRPVRRLGVSPTGRPRPRRHAALAGRATDGSAGAPTASGDAATTRSTTRSRRRSRRIRGLRPSRPVDAPVHRRRRAPDDADRAVRQGRRRRRTSPRNERLYKALGLIPADASLRDLTLDLLERRRRRLLPGRPGQAVRPLQRGTPGADRAVLLRPRVRPRAPGPELQRLHGPGRGPRPERPDPRPAGGLRRRRDARS